MTVTLSPDTATDPVPSKLVPSAPMPVAVPLLSVNPDGKVIEFLSYEGSFTATNGPAKGMTSTDIGVSERDSPPAGKSLQRAGSGKAAIGHTWQAPAAATPGKPNVDQTF